MRESANIEFKAKFINDLNKEVIAFANTNGGEIYIGLNDDGSSCGLSDINEVELQYINHIANTIKSGVTTFVKYEKIVIENKNYPFFSLFYFIFSREKSRGRFREK